MLKFVELREKILKALEEKKKHLLDEDGFLLIEGFVYYRIMQEIPFDTNTSTKALPMVVLIGSKTGRVYTFSLQDILPELCN